MRIVCNRVRENRSMKWNEIGYVNVASMTEIGSEN